MFMRLFCLCCGLALALAALSVETPLVKAGDRIAIFGDSISTGKGYGFKAVEWMNSERPDLKLTWLDHGHPGWRSDHAADAVDLVLADKPTLVTIMFGTNDLGQEGAKGIAQLHDRLKVLTDRFAAAGVRVVLLTPPYTSDETRWGISLNSAGFPRMGEEVFLLGREAKLPVFDAFAAVRDGLIEEQRGNAAAQLFNSPGDVHLNDRGHNYLGQALGRFLLGKAAPRHIPFYSPIPAAPVAQVAYAVPSATLALAPAGATTMLLVNEGQIQDAARWKGRNDLSASGFTCWDDNHLYITINVVDDVLLPSEKQPAWGHDGIEFFLDTRLPAKRDVAFAPGYYQLLVPTAAADGAVQAYCGKMDEMDMTTVSAEYQRTPQGYLLRLVIPWTTLKVTPKAGYDLGFDFAINDRDSAERDRYKALWRGWGDDYTNAGALGHLILSK